MSFGLHCMFQETFLNICFSASRSYGISSEAGHSSVICCWPNQFTQMHSMYIYLCVLYDRNAAACMICCLAVVVCLDHPPA